MTIQAKLGSMVAYQGDVTFEHAGSGGPKNLIGRGSGETVQMSFSGQGWVLVQPSEGRILGLGQEAGGGGGGLGNLLNS